MEEMQAADLLGAVPITIVDGPEEYLFGEEKALLEVIEGEEPLPRLLPPYVHGLFATRPQVGWSADSAVDDVPRPGSNPTLVSNVETIANVAPILARGVEWYRSLGTVASPGHVICTVVGDTRRAGVAEVEMGVSLDEVLVHIGAGTVPGRAFKAALSGVANPVLTARDLGVAVSYEAMDAIGTGLGACGFIVYDDRRDMAAVARAISWFLYVESCGQCPPCKLGTGEVTELLDDVLAGRATEGSIERMGARLITVTDANRCFLGAQEQRVIGSLLRAFPDDFVAHLEDRAPAAVLGADALVPKLVDIGVDGMPVHDSRQERKQPDWTYRAP
jgi:NADH-quinone oxidoreductase subunit F